ncbi:MAG: ecdysteroid 22-kinase family protein [Gammaproteobacteria bacterium]|nr:ecdysteroid 22-kinase family protein [Gammaproteobacteria bacterium]
MSRIPASVSDIDLDWIKETLVDKRLLDASLNGLEVESIGAGVGLMGEMARLKLRYEADVSGDKAPETLVVKCAAQNQNREVARILDFYQRESDFYNNLSAACPLNTPISYYSDVDRDSYDCIFVMQDLGEITVSDQVAGGTRDQARHSILAIADMHAKWWNNTNAYHWAYEIHSDEELKKLRDFIYMPSLEAAIDKFSDLISEKNKKILYAVGEHYEKLFPLVNKNLSFLHGDYRVDNIVYQEIDGALQSVVLDWQISGKGTPVFDIAYYLSQSLTSEICGAIEEELLAAYHDRLLQNGVQHYTWEECWRDYRLLVLFCLIYPVSTCGSLDLSNERGRELASVMMERNLSAVERLDSREFLAAFL